ncbi:hypothetical protein BJ138DRAFT_676446 [Hygrophoropsis aurantiaca]|uniref:Uncharacterized protein n=1 Tax=Hygrophoropsis aurantiaca TaxID=72124 RepID=A0ACB8AJG9_9AGAM|nr:hypothetical protein BJ138DRAFT_676446 [Hygrophoropsis aurantiaca]
MGLSNAKSRNAYQINIGCVDRQAYEGLLRCAAWIYSAAQQGMYSTAPQGYIPSRNKDPAPRRYRVLERPTILEQANDASLYAWAERAIGASTCDFATLHLIAAYTGRCHSIIEAYSHSSVLRRGSKVTFSSFVEAQKLPIRHPSSSKVILRGESHSCIPWLAAIHIIPWHKPFISYRGGSHSCIPWLAAIHVIVERHAQSYSRA